MCHCWTTPCEREGNAQLAKNATSKRRNNRARCIDGNQNQETCCSLGVCTRLEGQSSTTERPCTACGRSSAWSCTEPQSVLQFAKMARNTPDSAAHRAPAAPRGDSYSSMGMQLLLSSSGQHTPPAMPTAFSVNQLCRRTSATSLSAVVSTLYFT